MKRKRIQSFQNFDDARDDITTYFDRLDFDFYYNYNRYVCDTFLNSYYKLLIDLGFYPRFCSLIASKLIDDLRETFSGNFINSNFSSITNKASKIFEKIKINTNDQGQVVITNDGITVPHVALANRVGIQQLNLSGLYSETKINIMLKLSKICIKSS